MAAGAALRRPAMRFAAQPRAVSLATHLVQRRCVALGAPLSDARLAWLDRLVMRPLDAGGLLAKMDVFYLMGRMPTAAAANVNLAKPGVYDLVPVNSPTLVVDGYYETDGATSYLNTTYRPLSSGTVATRDSAHFGIKLSAVTGAMPSGIGHVGTNRILLNPTYTGGLLRGNIHAASPVTVGSVPDGLGHSVLVRADNANLRGYRDGVLTGTAASASDSLSGGNITLMRQGSAVFTAGRVLAAHAGAALTDADVTAIDAIFDAAWSGALP